MYKINYETIGGGKKIVSKRMIGAAAAEALESKENILLTNELSKEEIISSINEQNYDEGFQIPQDLNWTKVYFDGKDMDFKTKAMNLKIKFNCFKLRNDTMEENKRPLFVLPGYSTQSFGWTISRTSKYHKEIFSQGFSDIYVFDFTGIGGRKEKKEDPGINLQKIVQKDDSENPHAIDDMYQLIAGHIKENILLNFNDISILGRSAGGGLSLHIALTHQLPVKGLNVACPGVNMKRMEDIIPGAKKDLPIRLSFASKDKKVPIDGPDGGTRLSKLFFENNYSDFIYLIMSTTSDDDHLNHRLHPILLKNLV